jgi:hypothetical protein
MVLITFRGGTVTSCVQGGSMCLGEQQLGISMRWKDNIKM